MCVSTRVCVCACMCHRYAVNKNYEEKTKTIRVLYDNNINNDITLIYINYIGYINLYNFSTSTDFSVVKWQVNISWICLCKSDMLSKKTKKQQQPNHPQNPKQTMSMNCLEKQQHIHPTDIMVYGGKIVSKINYNNTVAHRL